MLNDVLNGTFTFFFFCFFVFCASRGNMLIDVFKRLFLLKCVF